MNAALPGHRRLGPPAMPTGQITPRPPPELQQGEGAGGLLVNLVPMLGSVGSIALVATMGGTDRSRSYLAAGLFLFATLGFVLVQVDRQRKQRARQVGGTRSDYLSHLHDVRRSIRDAAEQQWAALTWHHPDPSALPALAAERTRVWERGPAADQFLHVRHGRCSQPLAVELAAPEGPSVDRVDPAAASALHRLVQVHRVQHDLPATIDLRAHDRIELCGPPARVRSLARAMACSAAAFHAPEHLAVAVLAAEHSLADWDWVKWLPHAGSPRVRDVVGPRRMVATGLEELRALLPAGIGDRASSDPGTGTFPATPHVLLVVDLGSQHFPGDDLLVVGLPGVTVLDLTERPEDVARPTWLRLQLADDPCPAGRLPLHVHPPSTASVTATADQCDLPTAEALARRLAPLQQAGAAHTVGTAAGDLGTVEPDPLELLGLPDVRDFDPADAWRSRPDGDRLRVPIGLDDEGAPVHLDLKEAAQHGMGPHGLVVGATGSGKSELLRTLVLGLAMTHPPEQVNLVLVDFKGGATFAGLSRLPHVSAVITNLATELPLVDRMQDALSGELLRRQELLRAAGDLASIRDYERARAAGEDLAPLPSLVIVVDEFAELLSAKPEFIDLFVAIGRLGRSLGLHLLLASQRLEEGRLRGLESHLSYRVGLRTFSAGESRAVLGVADAHELPAVPGTGYLRTDHATLRRFKAAYVSGPPAAPRRADGCHDTGVRGGQPSTVLPFTVAEVPGPAGTAAEDAPAPVPDPDGQPSLLDAAVARMAGRGSAAHRVWLPPLDLPDTLDQLMPDLAEDPDLGLVSHHWRSAPGLVVPLGSVDRPREQRRDPLTLDLGGAAGHVAVVGGPRSGKSTLLRSLVTSTSLVATPAEAQFFVLDLGGGTFGPLARLPHVSGVATRAEPDVVRRVVAEVRGVVDRRETFFRKHDIDSVDSYRACRARGLVDDGWGDVFLVVDGWGTLRAEFDDLETELQQLAGRALGVGVHLLTSATRWADYRAALRDLLGSRIELRLGEPLDSEIDRRAAPLVPPGRPGRGLVEGGLHVLAALPRVDGRADPTTLADGVDDLVARSVAAWRGPAGPKLRLLPERVTLAAVREDAARRRLPDGHLLLGIDEAELAPVALDVDAEPHLLAFGDAGSGKTALLRSYVHEVVRTRSPGGAQVVLVDYRRALLGEVPDAHLLDHLTTAEQATTTLRELATYLQGRLPGPDLTLAQLRDRSWWTGAEVFVVVDDHDLVASAQASPLQALQPLLARAGDIGLHLVVARRSGGASRALHDPTLQSLRDLAVPGILLSGPRDEGPLIGSLRPEPAPPGRARVVTRDRGVRRAQLAWLPPTGWPVGGRSSGGTARNRVACPPSV